MWEADNVLTNFDPATRTMMAAQGRVDRTIARCRSRSQQLRRRGSASPTPMRRRRSSAAAGASSYVHFNRVGVGEPAADQRPAGRSTPSSTRRTRRLPTFRPTEQGYPAGLTDPSQVQPARRRTSRYMPRDYHSSPVQSWYVSVQRELGAEHAASTSRTSATGPDDLLLFANYNQAAPNNAAGTIPLQARRPDSGVRRHHLRLQRRQVALQRAAGASTSGAPRPA